MSIWRLQWGRNSIHTKLHKVRLACTWRSIWIFGCTWILILRWSHTTTQMGLWRLLHDTSSWFWNTSRDIKRLNSSIVSLYLLLETSLSLMARRWDTSTWSCVDICFRAEISLAKLILDSSNMRILGWVWHYLSTNSWTKLLTYVQSILDYWSPVWFLVSDHGVRLRTSWSFSICISPFSDILKLSLVTSCVIMIDCSIWFGILRIPVISRSSHDIILEVFSYRLRLPFLGHWLLRTRILNVFRWKLNGILVSSRSWITLSLHLS